MNTQGVMTQRGHLQQGNVVTEAKNKASKDTSFDMLMNKSLKQEKSSEKFAAALQDKTKVTSVSTKNFNKLNKTEEESQILEKAGLEQASFEAASLETENVDVKKVSAKAEQMIKEVVKEQLDITEEELESIMSQLGLTMLDLQNPVNLQLLLLEQTGNQDVTALLTDEDLSNQLQQLVKAVEQVDLEVELGISKEELEKLMEEAVSFIKLEQEPLAATVKQDALQEDTAGTILKTDILSNEEILPNEELNNLSFPQVAEDATSILQSSVTAEDTIAQNPESEEKVVQTLVASSLAQEEQPLVSQQAAAEDTTEAAEDNKVENIKIIVEDERKLTEESAQMQGKQEGDGKPKQEKAPVETNFDQFVQSLVDTKVENVQSFSNRAEQLEQMREIVTQVVEQIKVMIKPEATSMELQLNPENLGKINLSVIAKDGQITANFVTQNELARQALESQVQVLRENLENQGLKVDAIEVTVSDFNFQQSNQADGRQQQGEAKKAPRKLNIEEMDTEKEILTEEEQLAAKIMKQNGNQLDYIA